MSYIVRMPKLGVEMQTGVLLEWKVNPGEEIAEGDVLAEIESEKTVAEVAAREKGVLRRAFLDEKAEVEPGTAMGIVASADADLTDLLAEVEGDEEIATETSPADETDDESTTTDTEEAAHSSDANTDATASEAAVSATPKARDVAREQGIGLESVHGTGPKGAVTAADVTRTIESDGAVEATPDTRSTTDVASSENLLATPRARKCAAEQDVELAAVSGSGPHGSIRAADVAAAAHSQSQTETTHTTGASGSDASDGRTVAEERTLSGMRSTIARRLSESYQNAPHVTVDRKIDIEAALAVGEDTDSAVSVTDVLLKAVSKTLDVHPECNATFEDGVHRLYEEHNIGVAIDIEQGLVTPVLEDVGSMSVVEIAHRRRALVDRVQDRRYNTEDLQGGTFTVSNLGVLGVDSFTPIINPPEVAILGVNRIREVPRRTERGIEFRREMGVSLSFDHRVIDGADAARFLNTLADHLETAEQLLE